MVQKYAKEDSRRIVQRIQSATWTADKILTLDAPLVETPLAAVFRMTPSKTFRWFHSDRA